MFKLNNSGSAAVSQETFWLPIDETTPLGVKLQLHTRHGVAIYGMLTASTKSEYLGWAPCPKRPRWLLDLMSPYKKP